MKINFVNKTRESHYRNYLPDFELVMKTCLKHLNLAESYDVALILVKSKAIHKLNKQYRLIDRPTDVITFAVCDYDEVIEEELGDIFINVEAAISQSIDYGHSLRREINFLFLHGLLHCLGYDHLDDSTEKEMFRLQKEIMTKLEVLYE